MRFTMTIINKRMTCFEGGFYMLLSVLLATRDVSPLKTLLVYS